MTAANFGGTYGTSAANTLNGTTGFSESGLLGGQTIGSVTLATNGSNATSGNYNANTGSNPASWTITASAATGGTFSANNYSITYATGTQTITPAALTVTGMTAANKTYDTTNTATLNNSSDALRGVVAGHNNGGGTSDAVTLGTGSAMGTFASVNVANGITVNTSGFTIYGADAGDYILSQPSSTANITQASPIITWNNPANITYGTALNSTQLNASANVLGTFVYTPAAGTVLNVGSGQTLSVIFTPANTTDYTTATHAVAINVNAPTVTLSNPGNQTSTAGSTASLPLMAYTSNGDPLTYSAIGLPLGLSVSNGTISGTIASNAGSTTPYAVTITATDARASVSATQSFTWTVNPLVVTVTLSNPGNQTSTAGNMASVGVLGYASNGDSLTYSASGLPPGLTMNNGTISGTIASNAGSNTPYTVTVTATDTMANVSATQSFTWTVTSSLETVYLTNPGNQTTAAGNTVWLMLMGYASNGDALTYSETGLPPGLNISDGTISGTIASNAASGTPYAVTITATDTITGISATVELSWTVT